MMYLLIYRGVGTYPNEGKIEIERFVSFGRFKSQYNFVKNHPYMDIINYYKVENLSKEELDILYE